MSTLEAIIREARPEDYRQVCRLLDGLDELHRERAPWMFKAPEFQPRSEGYFASLVEGEHSAVLVADAGPLVGIACGSLRSAPDLPIFIQQRCGVLDALMVDRAWRRRGVGRLLARAFETWALGAGAAWVELNVYDFNPEARAFYESLGYVPLSTKLRKPTTVA